MKRLPGLIRGLSLAALLAAGQSLRAATIEVSGNLTGTHNWTADNTYVLTAYTYVLDGAVLNIAPGTVVKGRDGTAPNFGVLFVTQGGKLFASGTKEKPIIFTAETDDVTNPFDLPTSGTGSRGLWGGIVLLGKARINNSVNGSAVEPRYDIYEGLADTQVGAQFIHRFGGSDDLDSSGVMRYVSIRHGGKVLESAKEINGLSLCGVGAGTTIEYVETYLTADDGFEFFGGCVNTKYLISAFNDDDGFDFDQGHNGKHQFWFSIQQSDVRDEGSEANGQPNSPTPVISGAVPGSSYEIYNATFIGAGDASSGNDAFNIRVHNFCRIYNGVFTDFQGKDINIDGTSAPDVRDNIFFDFSGGHGTGWATVGANNSESNPLLNRITRTQGDNLDPRPGAGSPALTSSRTAPNDGFYTPVAYKGAFDSGNLWIAGWSALSQDLFTPIHPNAVEVSGNITGIVNWTADKTYILTGYTYVLNGAELHIEPGTIVRGRDGTAPNFGVLFVTQGGKIFANGTKDKPIVFTAEFDDVNNPNDLPVSGTGSRGLWGGIVLLGKARINNSVNGSAVEPRYDIYEGLADTQVGAQFIHRFGGTDDDDSSGVLRYVSIRHGGKVLESAKEINGLSLGGVGRGTTIEYVEAYLTADDGFEFFGGSVNTKYLVSAFNDDDGFDFDQGHNGKHQFWFGIQQSDVRDEGSEANGQPNSPTPVISGAVPLSAYEIYNATFIGAGAGSSGNDAFNIRVHNFCKIYNGIFTSFQGKDINIDGTSQPDVRDNLFFGFAGGNGTGYNTAFAPAADNPTNVDPLLNGISRAQDAMLDPRLQGASPALSSSRTPPNDGFYTQVARKGAFDSANLWIAGWTALSQDGFLPTVAPAIAAQPQSQTVVQGNQATLTVDATGTGPFAYQWYKNGKPIAGATGSSLVLSSVQGDRGSNWAGPSSSFVPLLEPTMPGFSFEALLSVGDGGSYKMVGIPDGLGAFDNGDGTFTVLMNHELASSVGINRAHGAKGGFVSKWVIDKSTLAVLSGQDLASQVLLWNRTSGQYEVSAYAISRLCSADLPPVAAFYNGATGNGTQNRIFMNGEENSNGKAFGFIATGPDAGKAYELPYLGKFAWENSVASIVPQDKTIVVGMDDDGTTDSQVYVYIGTKTTTGLDIDKAGLSNGKLYGVKVAGLAQEIAGTTAASRTFTLFDLTTVVDPVTATEAELEAAGNANGVTAFARVEDGAWDPNHPNDFYFVTTFSFTSPSRMWRLRFADITRPELGGFIDMMLDGTEGQKMMDNMGFNAAGDIIIQEDVGNQAHLGKLWCYNIASDTLVQIGQHRADMFVSGAGNYLGTQDEESSGVIDVTSILGYPASLLDVQVHGSGALGRLTAAGLNTTELVEDGQLILMREVDSGAYSVRVTGVGGAVLSSVANLTVHVAPGLNAPTIIKGAVAGANVTFTAPVFGTSPFVYTWKLNGSTIPGANSSSYTVTGLDATKAGIYTVEVMNAGGMQSFTIANLTLTDIQVYAGVTIGGVIGQQYQVQYATSLTEPVTWNNLGSAITLTTNPTIYVDTTTPSSSQPQRYYRVVPANN